MVLSSRVESRENLRFLELTVNLRKRKKKKKKNSWNFSLFLFACIRTLNFVTLD